jgi:hypothetical protein
MVGKSRVNSKRIITKRKVNSKRRITKRRMNSKRKMNSKRRVKKRKVNSKRRVKKYTGGVTVSEIATGMLGIVPGVRHVARRHHRKKALEDARGPTPGYRHQITIEIEKRGLLAGGDWDDDEWEKIREKINGTYRRTKFDTKGGWPKYAKYSPRQSKADWDKDTAEIDQRYEALLKEVVGEKEKQVLIDQKKKEQNRRRNLIPPPHNFICLQYDITRENWVISYEESINSSSIQDKDNERCYHDTFQSTKKTYDKDVVTPTPLEEGLVLPGEGQKFEYNPSHFWPHPGQEGGSPWQPNCREKEYRNVILWLPWDRTHKIISERHDASHWWYDDGDDAPFLKRLGGLAKNTGLPLERTEWRMGFWGSKHELGQGNGEDPWHLMKQIHHNGSGVYVSIWSGTGRNIYPKSEGIRRPQHMPPDN